MEDVSSLDQEETTDILSECGLTLKITVRYYQYFQATCISDKYKPLIMGINEYKDM